MYEIEKYRIKGTFDRILKSQISPGILIFITGALGLIICNSEHRGQYEEFMAAKFTVSAGIIKLEKTAINWINELLMSFFFLIVSLEIKREYYLKDKSFIANQLMLPISGAIGGVVIPALIFYFFNSKTNILMSGWAIPTATDIVFALAVLLLLGNRVPVAVKVLLTAIATIDDIIAIFIIGVFYSTEIQYWYIIDCIGVMIILYLMGQANIRKFYLYALAGAVLWFAMLNSGIHATLAGVVLALFIPGNVISGEKYSPLHNLERWLYPWVYFLILPAFAFANTGVYIPQFSLSDIQIPLPLSIALGLFVGKQIGVFSFAYIAIQLGIAKLHKDVTYASLYGISILCGIGFTMSLLIATLAYPENPGLLLFSKLGILIGSAASAILGYIFLSLTLRKIKFKSL